MFVLLLLLCLAAPCAARSAHKQGHKTPERDRPASDARSFMELFTKLERDWIQAVQRKDKSTLDAILAPEFMLRTSENPEDPLPRADWIQQALTSYDIRSFSHRAIAIRAFLGVAVVSFVQSQQATIDGEDRSGDYFIVDLWEANHDKWQVSARYVAPVGKHLVGRTKAQK
jgi:hypothetical protein